jgi:hypothetical protein
MEFGGSLVFRFEALVQALDVYPIARRFAQDDVLSG